MRAVSLEGRKQLVPRQAIRAFGHNGRDLVGVTAAAAQQKEAHREEDKGRDKGG